MSQEQNLSVAIAAFEKEHKVSVNDIASAMVLEWERRLEAQIATAREGLDAMVAQLHELVDAAIAAVDLSKFDTTVKAVNITCRALPEHTHMDWGKGEAVVRIELTDNETSEMSHVRTVGFERRVALPKGTVTKYNKLQDRIGAAREEMYAMENELGTRARKERELKARITMIRLEGSDAAALAKDADLLKLVQL